MTLGLGDIGTDSASLNDRQQLPAQHALLRDQIDQAGIFDRRRRDYGPAVACANDCCSAALSGCHAYHIADAKAGGGSSLSRIRTPCAQ